MTVWRAAGEVGWGGGRFVFFPRGPRPLANEGVPVKHSCLPVAGVMISPVAAAG